MRRFAAVAAFSAAAVLLVVPGALGAVSVTRAELSGGQLRVEGRAAVANATVTVSSSESLRPGPPTAPGASASRRRASAPARGRVS